MRYLEFGLGSQLGKTAWYQAAVMWEEVTTLKMEENTGMGLNEIYMDEKGNLESLLQLDLEYLR